MKYLIFDTETTGFPRRKSYDVYFPYTDSEKYDSSRLVSIAWAVYEDTVKITSQYYVIKSNGFVIDNKSKSTEIHGITREINEKQGVDINIVFDKLLVDLKDVKTLVAHNLAFDKHILLSEISRQKGYLNLIYRIENCSQYCTMIVGTNTTKIPSKFHKMEYKYPSLKELYLHYTGCDFDNAHNARADMEACCLCYQYLTGIK